MSDKIDERDVRIIEARRDFQNMFEDLLNRVSYNWVDFKTMQEELCKDKCKNYGQDGMCHYYRCPVLFNLDDIFEYKITIEKDRY